MPNGYGYKQIYFPKSDADLLNFVNNLTGPSKYTRDALRWYRAQSEETAEIAAIRRVVREELERILSRIPKGAVPNFGENFESSSDESGDEADLADLVRRNTF